MEQRVHERRAAKTIVVHERRKKTRRSRMEPTDIERENLEAHVEMCYSRYESVDIKCQNIETKIADIETTIEDKTTLLYTTLIKVGWGIICGVCAVVLAIYMK